MTKNEAHPILATLIKKGWQVANYLNLWRAHATIKQANALRSIYRKCAHPIGDEYTIDVTIDRRRYICHLLKNNCLEFSVFDSN